MSDTDAKLAIGIVGLGSMGKRYLSYLSKLSQVDISVWDINSSSRERLHELQSLSRDVYFCSSFDELLGRMDASLRHEAGSELLIISTPASTHLDFLRETRKRYPSGSILVEKPLSDAPINDEELRWCVVQAARGLIGVGYNWRFHPFASHLRKARNFICDLTLYVSSDMKQWPGEGYCDPVREFSHELDLVRYLTYGPIFKSIHMTPSGRFVIDGNHLQGHWRVRVDPYNKPSRRWVRVTMMDGSIVKYSWERSPKMLSEMYREQLREIIEATLDGKPGSSLTCGLGDALGTALLIDSVTKELTSIETGSGVVM
jgi:hypothetical protein